MQRGLIMNKGLCILLKTILVFLAMNFLVCQPVFAEINQNISISDHSNDKEVSITNLHDVREVSQRDLYEAIIDLKDDKIGLLQGNITAIIGLFSLIIALFGIIVTGIAYIFTKDFKQKFNELGAIKSQMAENEKWVQDVVKYFEIRYKYLEYKLEREVYIASFIMLKQNTNELISKIKCYDLGSNAELKDEYEYYIKTMKEQEQIIENSKLIRFAGFYSDYDDNYGDEDDPEIENVIKEAFDEYESAYNDLKQVLKSLSDKDVKSI